MGSHFLLLCNYSADRPSRGAEYCDQLVCLCVSVTLSVSISLSLEPLDRSTRIFVCRSPVAVARSSCGGVALRYVLPVLWMTSHLAVMGRMAKHGAAAPYSDGHEWRCETGAESDVYE